MVALVQVNDAKLAVFLDLICVIYSLMQILSFNLMRTSRKLMIRLEA